MYRKKVNLLLLFLCSVCVYSAHISNPGSENAADNEHVLSDSNNSDKEIETSTVLENIMDLGTNDSVEKADPECDCGEHSTGCRYTPWPEKYCDCEPGYSQKYDICSECSCGDHANYCSFHDTYEYKICNCTYGYVEVKGTCTETCKEDRDCLPWEKCRKEGDGYTCGCPSNYTGKECETHVRCVDLEPSCKEMGAICLIDTHGKPFCSCPPGQTVGLPSGLCEDTCNPERCLHGKCLDIGRGFYQCECDEGYTGRRCEEKVTKEACKGDRDCLPDQICRKEGDGYFCGCPANYTGKECETHVRCLDLEPSCKKMGATCLIDTHGEPFCRCPPGKTVGFPSGLCEDTCNPERCLHGKCLDIGRGFYQCECDEGYTGRRCEEKVETDTSHLIIGIIAVLGVVTAVSIVGNLYFICRKKTQTV